MRYNKYVVIYDIYSDVGIREAGWLSSSNKRRVRVVRILLEYGVRVQKSVFEIEVSRSELDRLISAIRSVKLSKGSQGDRIYMYPIEDKVKDKILRAGQKPKMLDHIFV